MDLLVMIMLLLIQDSRHFEKMGGQFEMNVKKPSGETHENSFLSNILGYGQSKPISFIR
jgi:hypothetical protein